MQTSKFALMVVPSHLQLIIEPSVDERAVPELLSAHLQPLVRLLPHTPFQAVGINFHWTLELIDEPLATASRRLFGQASRPVFDQFDTADAHFGAYLSRDVEPVGRMKVDIKPAQSTLSDGRLFEHFLFAFNFHRTLDASAAVDQIGEAIAAWPQYAVAAHQVVNAAREAT